MATPEGILEKLRKLQALADRAGTPEEAAAAASRVQALLLEHKLTMTDVEAAPRPEEYGCQDVVAPDAPKSQPWWTDVRFGLLYTVAHYNFCKAVRRRSRFSVVGKAHDAAAVIWLSGWLDEQVTRMAREALHAAQVPNGRRNTWVRAFYMGATCSISRRLWEQRERDKQRAGCTALVLASDAALNEALARIFPTLREVTRRQAGNGDAYAQGRDAGRRVNLNRPIAPSTAKGALR